MEREKLISHKCAAAALTGNIRELPHVADADGTARRKQDEAQAAAKSFSLHKIFSYFFFSIFFSFNASNCEGYSFVIVLYFLELCNTLF